MITERGLEPTDRPLIQALLESLDAFTPDERAVALELVDARLSHPESDDYRFILGFAPAGHDNKNTNDNGNENQNERGDRLAGYLCYGRTPMTQSTYDLYWLGTAPDFARRGVARWLVASMEREIAREGGGTIRVETGSREGHGGAVRFYDGADFTRTATIADFYAPGDDLIIFTKRIGGSFAPQLPAMDELALYDAAFGYRDYAAERDFLLACARRYGDGEVRRVLAWSCGPARHLGAFADVGIAGIGADASEAMLAYAQRIAGQRARSMEIRFVKAGFDEAPQVGAPVDLSFVPLSSVHLLGTPAALEAHLRLAAAALRPGGLHVIEATHPADLTPSGVHRTEWTEVRGDRVIDARFRMHIDKVSAERVVPVTLEVVCSGNRKSGAPAGATERLKQEDRWFIPDLEGWRAVIARVPTLKLAAALGDFNVDVPFENTAAWRLILVLKRVVPAE